MNSIFFSRRYGISFVEVLIAVLIVTACAIPVIYMLTSSRTETSRAINYLRAMELANEVIEWAGAVEYSAIDESALSAFCGSISEEQSGGIKTVKVATVEPENKTWKNDELMVDDLQYSDQYNTGFFFREVEISDVNDSYFQNNLLKKLTVRVKWSEGERPANLNLSDRTRQVELSVLLLNEKNLQL